MKVMTNFNYKHLEKDKEIGYTLDIESIGDVMNKDKGFTIPELLAVIVVIGVLLTMATASYIGISNNVKKRTLESKLELIKSKASEYASDNDITAETISVAKLINEGYLDSENSKEDNERISNPLGGFLDCYRVNIERNTDDYDISIDEDTSCEMANLDNISNRLVIYAYEGENNSITNYESIGSNSNMKWTNKDVYLYLDKDTLGSNIKKITWVLSGIEYPKDNVNISDGITSDVDNYANIFKVESVLLLNTSVYVKVETSDGLLTQKVLVKIDKEEPTLVMDTNQSYEKLDDNNNYKTISFNGSDGNGSGIGYTSNEETMAYYVSKDNIKPSKENFNIPVDGTKRIEENGTYYGYAIDAAGNISKNPAILTVTNVVYDKPVCLEPADNTTWINHDYTFTYGCKTDVGTGCSYSPKTGTISEEGIKSNTEFKWEAIDNVGNVVSCGKQITMMVDKTAPTCKFIVEGTAGKNGWYTSDVTLKLQCTDSLSHVATYGLSMNSNEDYNHQDSVKITGDTRGVTYYGYAKDNAGNVTKISKTIKIAKTPPSCTLSASGTIKNAGKKVCHKELQETECSNKGWLGIIGSGIGIGIGSNGNFICVKSVEVCEDLESWYNSDVKITMNTKGSFITSKTLKTPKGSSSNGTYTVNYDTKGVEVSGTVTNEAGLTGTCKMSVRRDTTAPKATLQMEKGTTCSYTVTYRAKKPNSTCTKYNSNDPVGCTNNGYNSNQYYWNVNTDITKTISCDDWTKNNYSDSTNLTNYLKTVNNNYTKTVKVEGPKTEPYESVSKAQVVCSDATSGGKLYYIEDTLGQVYAIENAKDKIVNWGRYPYVILSGYCVDAAGNQSSKVSQTFEQYEKQTTSRHCDTTFSKTDCSSGSNKCAHKNGNCSTGKEDSCDYDDCDTGSKECDSPDSDKDCDDPVTKGSNKWRVRK